ncbi:Zinc finger HIT domain-containing protein 2 [Coemansia sp. RSA 2618]|nr:Zinc finger HIT domain-containing protein 2 [Coemansia sp. RSA 2618]
MHRIVQRYQDQVEQDRMQAAALSDDDSDLIPVTTNNAQDEEGSNDEGGSGDEGGSEDEDGPSLADRLAGVDLNSDMDNSTMSAVWSRLTKAERDEFIRLITGDNVDAILAPWTPWWHTPSAPKIVQTDASNTESTIPRILGIGAPVKTLSPKVHPSVLLQLVQISLAYVYTMRRLNGDPRGENLGLAFDGLVSVAPLVGRKTADVFGSTHEAVSTGFCNIGDIGGEAKCALLGDMLDIYAHSAYVAAMVSDVYGIVKDVLGAGVPVKGRFKMSQARYAEKRMFFIISVVKQMQGEPDPWQFMAADLALLKRRYESESQALKDNTKLAFVG